MESKQTSAVVRPPQTIGILGGGQLGRMMILDGRKMGYRFATLDPTRDSPAGQVSDVEIIGEYDDIEAATRLADASDVITYEFENVDAEVAHLLETRTSVPQGSALLRTTQHRIREKSALASFNIPVAPFVPIQKVAHLQSEADHMGYPCILKTTVGGYDGKGQWMFRSAEDVVAFQQAYIEDNLSEAAMSGAADAPFVLEAFVPFTKELSVVVARNAKNEIRTFPVAENIHHNHILHLSIVPARVEAEIQNRARELACQIAQALNLIGLVAVEMFLTVDGALFVNELAPRPHNSGHYTMDACATSQFEQHVRAVCNLTLGDTRLLTPVVMVNILGEHLPAVVDAMPNFADNIKVHLYGKAQAKQGRKMGHLNVLADRPESALVQIQELGIFETV